jgi:hypothetical protein
MECLETQSLKVGASLTTPQYCVAAASWKPDGYSGACGAATTGFAFFASADAGASWAEVSSSAAGGCVPLLPRGLSLVDFITVYVTGVTLGGGGGIAAAFSADRGARWRTLALPAGLSLGISAPPLMVIKMFLKGGPVILSGLDPAVHCSNSSTSAAAACPAAPFSKDCIVPPVLSSAAMSLSTASRGVYGTVAYLGTYVRSTGSLVQNPYVSWLAEKCSGFSGKWYSTSYASACNASKCYKWGGNLSQFFADLAWGDVNPRLLFISEVNKGVLGILPGDQAIIDTHTQLLARFVSTGGALVVPGFQSGTGYGFLGTLAPLMTVALVGGSGADVRLTTATTAVTGAGFDSIGAYLNCLGGALCTPLCSPWHTTFSGNLGKLTCLAYEGTTCALVGG